MKCPLCGGSVMTVDSITSCNYCRTEFFPLVDKTGGLVVSSYVPVADTVCSTSPAQWVDKKFKEDW